MSNFLEVDSTALEHNLRVVKNELEDDFDSFFGGSSNNNISTENDEPARTFKIVKPEPGICIKCYKTDNNDKVFINLCQTAAIPPPEDISENELAGILQSDEPSSYRIPMSISEPRKTTDKSGNFVDACDIAINPEYFEKCQTKLLFRDFLIAIILEAINEKYNIEIKGNNWVVLKNRKSLGSLVTHRIQNRDVKQVYESYKNPSEREKEVIEEITKKNLGKTLIQEINQKEAKKLLEKRNILIQEATKDSTIIYSKLSQHRLTGKMKCSRVVELFAEFFLPNCTSTNDFILDIGEDRISLESTKCGYTFDEFVDYVIDQERVSAKFDIANKMLQVKLPLLD